MRFTLFFLIGLGLTPSANAQNAADPPPAALHHHMADSLSALGQFKKALHHAQRAEEIYQRAGASEAERTADLYELLGTICVETGQYGQALSYHQRALKVTQKQWGDTHPSLATCYDNVGVAYQHQGAHDQSLRYYRRALAIKKEAFGEVHASIALSYKNIGKVYQHQGEYDRALAYYQRALTVQKLSVAKSPEEVAVIYHNMGIAYRDQGAYDSALVYHRKTLHIRKAILGPTHPSIAMSYNNLGTVHRDQKEYRQALDDHHRALAILKQQLGAVNPRVSVTYTRIGRVYHQQGAYTEALLAYRQALSANGASFPRPGRYANPTLAHYIDGNQLLFTLSAKAKTLSALQLDSLACATYLLADQLLTQLNRSYATWGDKVSLASTAKQLYQRAVRTALRQYRTTRHRDDLQRAFYFSERSKAGVLSEALSTREAKRFGQVPDSLLAQEASLKEQRSFCRSQLATRDSSTYKRKLFVLNQQYNTFIRRLEARYPDYYQLKYATRTVPVSTIQQQLPTEEAVITYFQTDSLWYAFVITSDQFYAVPLISDSLLGTHLTTFQSAVRSDSLTVATFRQPAHTLYQYLVAPVIEDSLLAPVRRLTIIPDGPLGYLPFELLLNEPATEDTRYADLPYLLRDYTVHYGYSATWVFHPFIRPDRPATHQYIAFAPSYAEYNAAPTPPLAQRSSYSVPPLHFNRQEASNIRQYLPGVALTGREAVESRFKQEAHQYAVIHLAMHARADDQNPTNAQLIFSQDATDSIEDGFLHAYELYDMELSADLAVLSACETGYGKLVQGEGIMSLARAFAYAGCPSIVMSHWLVDDAASAQLMDEFYRHLSEGLPKDEALRQAKLAYMNKVPDRKAHPFFWSNFVLVGDAAPLTDITSRTGWLYLMGGSILLGIIAIAYAYRRRHRRVIA